MLRNPGECCLKIHETEFENPLKSVVVNKMSDLKLFNYDDKTILPQDFLRMKKISY